MKQQHTWYCKNQFQIQNSQIPRSAKSECSSEASTSPLFPNLCSSLPTPIQAPPLT